MTRCPHCHEPFHSRAGKRYCCNGCKVAGCRKRKRDLTLLWCALVGLMSMGRISSARAQACLKHDRTQVERICVLWGFRFDGRDLLVNASKAGAGAS